MNTFKEIIQRARKSVLRFIVLTGLLLAPVLASAQSGQSLPFINQSQGDLQGITNGWLAFTSLSTNSYASTNLAYTKGFYITNVLTAITNPANGLVITGYISQAYANWVTNASGLSDITLWANADGTVALSTLMVETYGINANFTNDWTANFATVSPDGTADSTNTFAITGVGNGTAHQLTSANVPLAFMQGQRKLRLTSFVSNGTASNGTNGYAAFWLSGYKPPGME